MAIMASKLQAGEMHPPNNCAMYINQSTARRKHTPMYETVRNTKMQRFAFTMDVVG